MKISEYAKTSDVFPEVIFAGEYLERHGEMLGAGFTVQNAIDKAAEMMAVFMSEDSADWRDIRSWFQETGSWVEYT